MLRRNRSMLALLLLVTMVGSSTAQVDPFQIEALSSTQLFGRDWIGIKIDAIIDVRTAQEFATGHVPGAMLVDSLGSFGTNPLAVGPQALAGCEYCDIAAYCASGNRAAAALRVLQQAGFKGRLYNAGTINQWRDLNYPVSQSASLAAQCTTNPMVGQQCLADFNARSSTNPTTTQGTPTTAFPQQQPDGGVVRVNFFDWNSPVFEASGTVDEATEATTSTFPEPVTNSQAMDSEPASNFAGFPAQETVTNVAPERAAPVVQWGTAQWTDPEEQFPDFSATGTAPVEEVSATTGTGTGFDTTGGNNNGSTINWAFGGTTQTGQQREQAADPNVSDSSPGGNFVDRWSGNTWVASPAVGAGAGTGTDSGTNGGTSTQTGQQREQAADPVVSGSSPEGNFVDQWSGNTWVASPAVGAGAGTGTVANSGTGAEPMFAASSNENRQGSFPGFSFVNVPGSDTVPDTSAPAAGATDPVSGSSFTDWFTAFSSTSPSEEAGNDNTPTGFAPPVRGGTGNTWDQAAAAAETTQVEDTWGDGKVVWFDALESGAGTLAYKEALMLAAPLFMLLL